LAPTDYLIRTRNLEVYQDFFGRKYAIYRVGGRVFVQRKSGARAVEVYKE